MLDHQGHSRTFEHNLRIASLLSFVAGLINVVGVLSINKLTTNVTGHFAYFIDEVFQLQTLQGLYYFLYIFFFLLGSFCANFIIEILSRYNSNISFRIPLILESILLLIVPLSVALGLEFTPNTIAYILLFAMGLQNSMVTKISNAVVRTTHLTGLFTDLGIDLSQILLSKTKAERAPLRMSIRLRLTIISFFFIGGIVGGIGYSYIQLYSIIMAVAVILIAVIYSSLKHYIVKE